MGLPNVRLEDESSVALALALSAQGLDFADALHLASKPQGVRFTSFDQTFVRGARKAGAADAVILDSRGL
jgi:predicted nucleic acid-binding protein